MDASETPLEPFLRLERRDLIRFEQRLRRFVARFFPYTACSLHFPGDNEGRKPEYIAEEERLLLPLYAPGPLIEAFPGAAVRGRPSSMLLGVFVARGVAAGAYDPLAAHAEDIAASAMENLLLYKAALCDPVTGLFMRRHFLARMAEEVRGANDALRPQAPSAAREVFDPDMPSPQSVRHPCLAVLVVRLHGLRQVVRKHGYAASEEILSLLGEALRNVSPEQGAAARISDYELAVLMPSATGKTCRRLAGSILEEFGKISIRHELTRLRIRTASSVGYALYPQDITRTAFIKSAPEQAQALLRKARLAAALAAERLLPEEIEPTLAFGRILAEGGRIVETQPMNRLAVNLGAAVNAREGQRFSVWSSGGDKSGVSGQETGVYKGEIVLVEVRENSSIAEIIHLADPSRSINEGDPLTLLPDEVWGASRASARRKTSADERDPLTGLMRHGDFLASWSAEREMCDVFSLALLRLIPPSRAAGENDFSEEDGDDGVMPVKPEELMAETVRLFRDVFGVNTLGGRYGLTSLIAFHPDASPESLKPKYEELCSLLMERFFPGREGAFAAVGLAGCPYLDYRKADVLENCSKALEYGVLLPAPHVGVFDSLAITISADKRFSHGDVLGAMTEYKQALLADGDNALAWNSLGVALARLGRHGEARIHFDRAIALEPDAMTFFNMGYSCQCLDERQDARRYYEECLAEDAEHVYAMVRLGQLAESENDYEAARDWYDKAGALPEGGAVTRRCLAGLALRENNVEEAREFLHEALALDPQNAVALQMLAEIYLDGGEDAEVAEALARQSVALRPGRKAGWLALARAFERGGRRREAREALVRAGSL